MNFNFNLEHLINEWFVRLPQGYATKPYSYFELAELENLLEEKGLDPAPLIKALTESQVDLIEDEEEDDADGDGTPDDTKNDRFIADSQEWMKNPKAFQKYILDNYTSPGQQIQNIDVLYSKIQELPDKSRKKVIEILGRNTNRKLSNGTYKMGQYEKELFEKIKGSIKVAGGHYSELWFAIIHDGKVAGGVVGDSGIESDVDVEGDGVSLKNFKKLYTVNFGSLDPATFKVLKGIISLTSTLTGTKVTKSNTRSSINGLLDTLSSEDVTKDIEEIIEMSKDTKIGIIKRIGNKLETALGGRDPGELVNSFCDNIDQIISKKLNTVDWWGIIHGDMVYLSPSSEIYAELKCKDNRLSTSVASFEGAHLRVAANKIHKEIVD